MHIIPQEILYDSSLYRTISIFVIFATGTSTLFVTDKIFLVAVVSYYEEKIKNEAKELFPKISDKDLDKINEYLFFTVDRGTSASRCEEKISFLKEKYEQN